MNQDSPNIRCCRNGISDYFAWYTVLQSRSFWAAKPQEKLSYPSTGFGGADWQPGRPGVRSLLFMGLGLLILGFFALWVDHPLSWYMVTHQLPDVVEEICHAAEPFGNGVTVLLLLIVLHRLVPQVRPFLPRLAAISLGSGLAASVIKLLIPRFRPRHFDFTLPIWDSFQAAFDFHERTGAVESFPSAHTATACGLAIGLSWLWPEARAVFWFLAGIVAAQRVVGGAHFLSDVLVAAAFSCFVGAALLSSRGAGRAFSALESSLHHQSKALPVEQVDAQQ
jgi:membrane-associated phospholipid phosphatase